MSNKNKNWNKNNNYKNNKGYIRLNNLNKTISKEDVPMALLIVFAVWLFAMVLSFGVIAGLTYLIFLCFGLAWTWQIAIGIWLCWFLFNFVVGGIRVNVKQ